MALLRGAQKLNQLARSTNATSQRLSLLVRDSPRHFSNESDPPQSQISSSSPVDSFLQPPSKGPVYGKLFGINSNTLKSDIINLFEESNLGLDDIKVEYNATYYPMSMLVQFSSPSDFNAAIRMLRRKGQLLRLEKADREQWDPVTPYNGRYLLLQGLPRNALIDDVERFLFGCNHDSSSLEMFTRRALRFPDPIRMAKVRFPSAIEAMNAAIRKNGDFCLNSRIGARVIQ